jgi:hypothetical protein
LTVGALLVNSRETFPLPWRYVLLPSGSGGYNRVAYLILAANGVEVCILSDLRTAQIVSAPNNPDGR